MAASNGMNMAVGLDLSQLQKDLQKLTSSVENISDQLGKRLELKPTINTKAYEAAVDKMDVSLKKLQDRFSKGFDFVRKGVGENGSDIKDSFSADSLFGSIDKMKASVAQLKGMLRNPGKYELNVGDAKELVGLQELIIKNWQTSTNEIHKQDAAVKSLIAKEVKLRNETKQRINDSISRHERDRADAKNLNRRIDQIRAERVAIGKLISDYEQLAAKQRKFGESDAGTNRRIAALRQEHTQYKNLEREELNRQKALNQNNALFNDQERIIGKLKTLASRYISIFTIGTLARKVAETTGFFERQQVALEGIVGSVTKAAEIMGQIKSFAPNSPFQTKQLIEYTKQLAAYNVAVDDLFPKTKMLADLSAGLGVDMQRLILAYGQVNAASVLRGQELRQFTEAGIPMVQALADKFTQLNGRIVTTGEVFELISKRQVSFEMVSQVLTDMTSAGGKFHNMQANLMGTVYGQIEKLKDLWTLSLDQIGKSSHGTITKVLSWMQAAVKNASSIFRGFVITIVLNSMGHLWSRIKLLRTGIGLIGVAAKGAFGAISLGIGVAYGVFRKLWDENHKIQKQFNEIHESFQKQIDTAKEGLDEIIQKLNSTTEGTKSYQDAIDALTSNYSQYITLNDEIIQQLMQMGNAYDNIKLAIDKYNDALEKKQQLEAARNVLTEAFDASKATKNWRQYISGYTFSWDGIDNNDIQPKMELAIQKVFNEMLSQNKLSYSKNKEERYLQNRATYEDLFRKYMKAEGLEAMLGNLNMYQLFQDFSNSALFDNDSRRAYREYRRLTRESMGEGVSDFAWLSRIENTFKDLSTTLPKQLNAQTPQGYTNEYNKAWISAALGYMNIEDGDFDSRRDANGDRYADAEFVNMIKTMEREIANFNQASVYNVENAMNAYHAALAKVDSEGAAMLLHFLKLFQDGTEEANGRAAAVRETIFKTWEPTSAEMKFARQFLPTNQSYNTTRTRLPQEHISRIEELAQYGVSVDNTETIPTKRYKIDPNRKHSPADLAEIERIKMEERVIAKLMEGVQDMAITVRDTEGNLLQAQMFDISDREKDFRGGGNNREFPEWVNIFKDAYELYKKATTEGGMEAGIAKVRTDKTIQEMYGDFFGSAGSIEAFKFKIGGKTIAQIIQDNLITGGLEDGIVDFKSAAKSAAEEMIRYGKADEEKRGHFVREGQRLLKWVADTFADDSVAKWINELSKATQDLTISFENMRADQDLARKMLANGTLDSSYFTVKGSKGAFPSMESMARSGSDTQRSFIRDLLGEYNQWAAQAKDENGVNIATPFNLDDIADALKQITDESDMNMQAFRATKEGNIMMSKLTAALKELDKTVREEAARISGKAGTGNRLSDAVYNAKINADRAMLDNETIQKIAAALKMSPDQVAASIRVDAAKSNADDILKAFLESNNYETMFKAFRQPIDFSGLKDKLNDLIAALPELEKTEIERRYAVMQGEADVFNAKHGDFAPFFAGLDNYRTADSRAQEVWNKYATDSKATELGATFNADKNAWDIPETITDPEALAYLNQLNRSLDEVGKNGIKLSAIFKKQALDSVKEFASTAQNTLDAMSGVVKNLVSSVQSFVKAFNKAYDVMNDGENPKWMQDTEAFLGDFAENFEAMIAPMSAVIALIIAITVAITVCEEVATPLLIVMAAVVAAAAIMAAIIAAFQQHDRKLEHSIEGLKEDVEAFDRAITNLQAVAERSVGFEKLRNNIAATGKELEKATAYAEMARLEEEKKNTDDDKVKEYMQSYQEAMDSFLNGMREVRDELATATEEWANQMGSAIRSAFQNGENAARAFRDTVKTMIGDVIENMLEMAILQPLIENALENWTNSDYLRQKYTKEWTEKDENGNIIKRSSFDQDNYLKELLKNIGDPDKAENFYQSMLMIGDTLIDTVNGMPSVLQDFYKYNSELGTLSGGIESVTEDTARRIEALENSQLGEVFAIRTMLQNYLEGSGFGDSMTADLQAAIASIASDTNLIRIATESILSRIDQMRNSNVQPLHVTIV